MKYCLVVHHFHFIPYTEGKREIFDEVKSLFTTVLTGIMLPFIGTALGSGTVFIMKKNSRAGLTDCLSGFAGGVMLAASVWSLLLPSIEESGSLGRLAFIPSAVGFLLGIVFMLFGEMLIEKFSFGNNLGGTKSGLVTAFAVTVHNIPEGMAVGMVYASLLSGADKSAVIGALSLSIGIAVQNIPEGAIVSLPLFSSGQSRGKAFFYGVLSGAVEPVAGLITILCVRLFSPLMAYFLSFAAGAMIFVVMQELSDEMKSEKGRGMLFFALGFALMMSMDVGLG